jgi:hypothetical protein
MKNKFNAEELRKQFWNCTIEKCMHTVHIQQKTWFRCKKSGFVTKSV